MELNIPSVEQIYPRMLSFLDHINGYTWLSIAASLLVIVQYYLADPIPGNTQTIGKRSKYEPLFFVRQRFFQEGWPMITEGYKRVSLLKRLDPRSK